MKMGDLYPNYELRDKFATLALQELMRACVDQERQPDVDAYAKLAYEFADAMMEARMGR